MNCTKYTPPLQIFVDFYYYYSYFTIILTLLISPLQFYIILTKSKSLNNFKWLILNQSFWCFVFEMAFTIVKPFLLAPAAGGFPLGLLRNGNWETSILGISGFCFVLSVQMLSLMVTFINRYLFVFPLKVIELVNKKLAVFGLTFISFISLATFIYIMYPYFFIETSEAQKAALEFDPGLKMYFNETAFIFFALTNKTFFTLFIIFLFCCFIFCAIVFLLCFFIYRVYFHESVSIVKLQKSLITSVIVQAFISLIFLCLPIFGYVFVIVFQISNSFVSNLTPLGCCAIASHSLLESVATLYFVAPYRKAIKGYLEHYLPYFFKKVLPKVAPIQ